MSSSPALYPPVLSGDLPAWICLPAKQLPQEVLHPRKSAHGATVTASEVRGSGGEKIRLRAYGEGGRGEVQKTSCCEFKERSPAAVALKGGSEGSGKWRAWGHVATQYDLKHQAAVFVLIFTFLREIYTACVSSQSDSSNAALARKGLLLGACVCA